MRERWRNLERQTEDNYKGREGRYVHELEWHLLICKYYLFTYFYLESAQEIWGKEGGYEKVKPGYRIVGEWLVENDMDKDEKC